MIVYDDLEPSEKIKIYDKGITVNNGDANGNGERYKMLVGYRTGDVWAPQLDITEALSIEARHFVESIKREQPVTVDGQAGLRVVRMLAAATESMRNSGRPVELAMNRCSV
jgi:predicted dehydrogenase